MTPARGAYLRDRLARAIRARVAPGLRILELGPCEASLLEALHPSYGVAIDRSASAVAAATARWTGLPLHAYEGDLTQDALLARIGGPFDVIVVVDLAGRSAERPRSLARLHRVCHAGTRLLAYGRRPEDVRTELEHAGFEIVRSDAQVLCPVRIPALSELINRCLGPLPPLRSLSLLHGSVARPAPHRRAPSRASPASVSVVIPCRNEAGHIRSLAARLPELGPGSEFLFVEGHSTDDTKAVLRAVLAEHPDRPFRVLEQAGVGKGDAVRLGFSAARGDIVLILDADMGVAPEDIPKFVIALERGEGELINGSRFAHPMEPRAMPFLNRAANRGFASLLSFLIGQPIRDALCGTKALYRRDYERIAASRAYLGDLDPFGDFDLLLGAARLDLRIVDLAVRYHERQYGSSNIERFKHGFALLRMAARAARKLVFV